SACASSSATRAARAGASACSSPWATTRPSSPTRTRSCSTRSRVTRRRRARSSIRRRGARSASSPASTARSWFGGTAWWRPPAATSKRWRRSTTCPPASAPGTVPRRGSPASRVALRSSSRNHPGTRASTWAAACSSPSSGPTDGDASVPLRVAGRCDPADRHHSRLEPLVLVYLNGEFVPQAEARISVDDRGFLFADGVYEVVRVYDGRPFLMDAHLGRMRQGLHALRIDDPGVDGLAAIAERLLDENRLRSGDATIYIQITRGAAPRAHVFPPAGTPPTVYVAAKPFQPH